MTDLLAPITLSVVAACIVLIVAIAAVLHRGARLARAGRRPAAQLAVGAGAAQAGWFVATALIGASGLYAAEAGEIVPWIAVGLAVPLVLGTLALWWTPVTRALTHERIPALLAAVQTVRIVGGVFLVLLVAGQLPAVFALPAGIGDVLVGVAAPFVAVALWRQPQRRALGIAFNALGLLDLIVAIGIGVAVAPGPLQLVVTEPSTALMGLLPLVLVPTFVVPLAIVLHVASFRLLGAPRTAVVGAPAAA